MALYRRGTASMDADGTVRGTDTKWKDQLALIRVGATIVFLEQPIKLAVISDIVSDTELKAISTDGQTAADGKYVILLNDSLTVNGLAQNVAETLRYYQSKETEIAGAMDIIASLDMDNLNRIIEEIKANKSAAESAKNQAELARDAANAARDEANATKGQVQQIVDGAVGSINSAKDQAVANVQQKENSAVMHINSEEASAIQAINDAKGDLSGYVNDAQTAAQTATSAKNDAQLARNDAVSSKDAAAVSAQQAKDAANSVDAKNLAKLNANNVFNGYQTFKGSQDAVMLQRESDGDNSAVWLVYKSSDGQPAFRAGFHGQNYNIYSYRDKSQNIKQCMSLTPNGSVSFPSNISGGSSISIKNGARALSLSNSGSSKKDADIRLWGSNDRPSVIEFGLTDGYLYYAQQNADGSRTLKMNGNIECNTLHQVSDRDLKDNIEVISNATESIRKMRGYTYNLKSNGMPYAGVIAQEVMDAIPEAIAIGVNYEEFQGVTKDGGRLLGSKRYLSVDYSAVTGLLVQVCRESDDRISKLENQVEEMKSLVEKLINSK